MEPITAALINAGGLGILAAVLLFLHVQQGRNHREDLNAFRLEMIAERAQRDAHHQGSEAQRDAHHKENLAEFKSQRHTLRDLMQMVLAHHASVNVFLEHVAGVKRPTASRPRTDETPT